MKRMVDADVLVGFASHDQEPDHREAVIVTSDGSIDRGALAEAGMEVTFVSRDGNIAAGTVDRDALDRLAGMLGIVSVEADTQAHALDG